MMLMMCNHVMDESYCTLVMINGKGVWYIQYDSLFYTMWYDGIWWDMMWYMLINVMQVYTTIAGTGSWIVVVDGDSNRSKGGNNS